MENSLLVIIPVLFAFLISRKVKSKKIFKKLSSGIDNNSLKSTRQWLRVKERYSSLAKQ